MRKARWPCLHYTHFVVYTNAKDPTPSKELHSREELAPVFAGSNMRRCSLLDRGNIFTLTDDRATGEVYCIAHHFAVGGEGRRPMVAYLRYDDTIVTVDGS
jgi:hypothetical protein